MLVFPPLMDGDFQVITGKKFRNNNGNSALEKIESQYEDMRRMEWIKSQLPYIEVTQAHRLYPCFNQACRQTENPRII